VPEIRRLWRRLLRSVVTDAEQVLAWSHWRRYHQWVALHCHYRRQQATDKIPTGLPALSPFSM